MKIAEIIETLETIDNNYEIFVCERQALDSAIELLERSEWIPVSERLPEENETVLISAKYIAHLSRSAPYVEEGFLTRSGWYSAYGDNYSDLLAEVTAWMPLPEPYKGGESE